MDRTQDLDERILLQEVNEIAYTISAKMDAERPEWEPSNHEKSNWASEAAHPCNRFLVYCRLNWAERKGLDLPARYRVQDGKRYESMIRGDLEAVGYEVLLNQASFRWEAFEISGKIDGMIAPPGYSYRRLPFEIKCMGSYLYERVLRARHVRELIESPIYWIRKIPSQLNIYLLLQALPAGLLILKSQGHKPKILPMILDYDLADQNLERLISVNEHVRKKTYPPKMKYDKKLCDRCDFHHLCLPVPTQEFFQISPEIKTLLADYCEAKTGHREYTRLHAKLIGSKDDPGIFRGKNLVVDDFEISSTEFKKAGVLTTRTAIDRMVEGDLPWD